MSIKAGMTALALGFPEKVRTNAYWHENYPEVVKAAEKKTLERLWQKREAGAPPSEVAAIFDEEMAQYLKDPFRGTKERRVLAEGETSLTIEKRAAERALAAAGKTVEDVDLLLVSSFLPDTLGVGNAAYLAQALGTKGMAFNIESACSGSLVGLQTATALVEAGHYRRVLVVVSCTYSRNADDTDTLSWTVGDGAAAFLVEPVQEGGVHGFRAMHTALSCGALSHRLEQVGPDRLPAIRMRATSKAGPALRTISETCLREACEGALKAAGMKLSDVDFFIFNSPVAWYTRFCARALGVSPERTVDTYTEYGNVGPVLMPANLHRAASTGKLKKGDRILLYTVGSVSSAGAAVMTWGDVALG